MIGFSSSLFAKLVGVALAVGSVTAGVALGTADAAQSSGLMSLVSQTPYVPAEGTLELAFSWSADAAPANADLRLSGTLFSPMTDESEVPEAPQRAFASIPPVPLASLPRTDEGGFVFTLPIRSVPDGDPSRRLILEAGVFPLVLEISDAEGRSLASLRTNMIRLPSEAAEIKGLKIALLLEISSAEGLTLVPATDLLARHPLLPIAVQLGDGVITQLETSPTVASEFSLALGERPVITAPALNLDPSSLARLDRPDLYVDVREQTFARLRSLGLEPATDTVPIETNLTAEGVDLLLELGNALVVDTGPRARPTGFIEGTTGNIRLVQTDDTLTSGLRGGSRSVERVHRLLASLSLRSQVDRSPILLGGAALRDVPIGAIDTLLSALDAPGLLTNASISDVANDTAVLPIRPDEQPSQDLDDAVEPIRQFTVAMETYEGYFVDGAKPPSLFEARLLNALSPDLNPTDRLRALTQLVSGVEGELQGIVLPDGQSVTLAAQEAAIPLTVDNRSDGVRNVLFTFESDKINVKQDRTTMTLPPGVSTIDIDLQALSLGQSPLRVTIYTPDETTELARTQFAVRSTAIPGLGLLLSAAALVFLFGWWIITWTRTRALRSHPANVQADSSSSGS